MAAEVVDASAVAALLFAEPGAERLADALEGAELCAPSLIRYELASVCLKKCRLYPAQRQELVEQLDLYRRLGVAEVEVSVAELALVGNQAGVTAYDAAYLWVALQAGTQLRTLDRKLAAAAARVGVPLKGWVGGK